MKKEINIFIIAPSDVDEEREAVRDVCKSLDKQTRKDIHIQAISWKQVPMFYKDNPQKSIDTHFHKSDIYVVILWNRIGTIVEGLTGAMSHSIKVTGTQYEIEYIIASEKESVLFYLKNQEYQNVHIDDVEEMGKQKKALGKFLEEIELLNVPTKYGYQKFTTVAEFKRLLIDHLSEILKSNYKIKVDTVETLTSSEYKDKHRDRISDSYYAGLYGVLVLLSVMLFQTTNFLGTYSEDVKQMSTVFVLTILAIVIVAVQGLSTSVEDTSSSFKNVVYALLRRGTFIVGFAILLSFYFWVYVGPQIMKLFG
jgi:hypothetical protein